MSSLTEYERKVLAAFAGNSVDHLRQGAALNQAAEMLVASGYMGAEGNLHDKGFTELGFKSPLRSPAYRKARPMSDHPEIDTCPICAEPLNDDDICATDIEMGICHAACLEGSPTVDLETGEEVEGPMDTYRYGDTAPKSKGSTDAP